MFQSISRITFNSVQSYCQTFTKSLKNIQTSKAINQQSIRYKFATKKKRVIELNTSKIDFESLDHESKKQVVQSNKKSYLQLRQKIQTLPWEQMQFNQLCSLDQELIDGLQTELKKDKFNISDQQFLASQLQSGQQIPLGTYDQLDKHYKKIYTLLQNSNDYYDEFGNLNQEIKKGYLHQIYLMDLKNDKQLNQIISRFIKYVDKPQRLQAIAEPTFVKYLLSLKRQLMLQGIHFETKAQKKQAKQKGYNIIQSNQLQQFPKIKILQILNYEYEFWQDVKHNRAKNGSQDNFIIQTKQVPNPNQSVLLKDLYPTVNIKYIARHKTLKTRQRCFCLKADLLIQIDQKMKRKIKIQWKGPSDTQKSDTKNNKVKAKRANNQSDESVQEQAPRVDYMVIDYENIYDGNPTIRPIFYF